MTVVTGATGFIGRHLMPGLVDSFGRDAVVCLVHDSGDAEAEREGRAVLDRLDVRQVPVELVSGRGLERAPRSPSRVLHLASDVETGHADHRVDDVGTRRLLDALGPIPRTARFVFASSIAVQDHRDGPRTGDPDGAPLRRPYNEYGRRKLAAEGILRAEAARQGFSLACVRLGAAYGRGFRDNGVFERVRDLVRRDSPIARLEFPGKLSVLHVEDAAAILLALACEPCEPWTCETVVASSEVLEIRDVIEGFQVALGRPREPFGLPRPFWQAMAFAGRQCFRVGTVLPHPVANALWRVALTVTDAFDSDPEATRARFPGIAFRSFAGTVRELA